ncbi:U1 small nuclear ribonucleoprotein 70 kDa-like [Uranotaenia lowii]|uniref:U1 small nuclear ribonucleoprotein 70 kDa-like n=1 Tax=Uranotaenia lowii TaxID=190385 RepID=UPI0024787F61|nr:U1 small nuclear ribonucleoprotein 70 kDa-like [Uranotaenia lowii]
MTQYLPPNLLALFAPREPIPFLPPPDKLPHEKKSQGYGGVGAFMDLFEDPKDTPPPTRVETREERLERRRRERAEQVAYKLEREIAIWDPQQVEGATEDPFRTLFVARINYDTSESKLRREFEIYGNIKKIKVITSKDNGKPRGYAFIEYEHERDMHSAYKHADGKKIDGKRVLVDVERARTVKGWLPRRLGGGLGGTRRGGAEVNIKHSGREDNERERERYRLEQREREERDRRGDRFEPRFDRRRSRSRDRAPDRRRRSRSKDRRRRYSREREHEDLERKDRWGGGAERERSRERDRDRDRDRERDRERDRAEKKRRRSRSRSRSRDRERDRGDKKRDKRDKDRDRERKERKPDFRDGEIKIKEEPQDDYPDYSAQYDNYQAQIKNEDGEEEKYRPHEDENGSGAMGSRGGGRGGGENGGRYAQLSHNDDDDDQYDDGDRYAGY